MAVRSTFGFGQRLKAARTDRGLSGAALGAGLADDGSDVTRQSVSDWEAERHYPKANQLREICTRLGVTADHLLFGADVAISPAVAALAKQAKSLSPEERAQVASMLASPAHSDEHVENNMPITKTLKAQKPASSKRERS